MRIYDVAFFMLVFNLVLGMMSEIGFGGYAPSELGVGGKATREYINETVRPIPGSLASSDQSTGVNPTETFSWFNLIYKSIVNGIPMVLNVFFSVVSGGYTAMRNLKIPDPIALTIASIVWFIYAMGFIQLMWGRSTRELE